MVKRKVADLEGLQLRYAVALTQGLEMDPLRPVSEWQMKPVRREATGFNAVLVQDLGYDTDWSFAGPLIDKYKINFAIGTWPDPYKWKASIVKNPLAGDLCSQLGNNHMQAAMRVIVFYELGEEVEIPEELA